MMTYTRSAIGLLTRQYKAVLKKCFLINCGLFALGAVGASPAKAVLTPTLNGLQKETADKASTLGTYLGTYALTELTSATAPAGTTVISFNGKRYYYTTPTTLDADKTNMLKYLSGSTAVAMTSTGATAANSVFSISGTNYTFDKTKLPVSVWSPSDGTSTNYNYITYNSSTPQYHLINIGSTKLAVDIGTGILTWTKQVDGSGYSYSDTTTFPLMSTINYTDDGAGGLSSATGEIRFKLPGVGTNVEQYYSFNYTPSGSKLTRINNNLSADIDGGYFYNDGGTNNGGAIYNTKDHSDLKIKVDFIKNYVSKDNAYGGAIYNNGGGKIESITGNFINNYTSNGKYVYGGAIANYSASASSETKIGNIVGNFVGNFSSGSYSYYGSYGGAIYNHALSYNVAYQPKASIGSIVGNFIGNYSKRGGAISNDISSYGTVSIGSIVGNFIGNYSYDAGTGGAIYNGSNASISDITGDFINNYALGSGSVYGGAIYNKSLYYTTSINNIIGDFINNYALGSGRVYGGTIYNSSIMSSITGDFIGNYAKTTSTSYNAYGGAIFNGSETSGTPQYQSSAVITLAGNTFTGNYVDNNGTITPNSIYNAGVINIADGATVTINDGYDGLSQAVLNVGSSSVFNLNGTEVAHNIGVLNNSGAINLANNVTTNANGLVTSSVSSNLNLNSNAMFNINTTGSANNIGILNNAGTVNLANNVTTNINGLITGSTGNINIGNSAIFNINENNGTLQTDSLGAVTNNGTINWDLDVDLVGTNSDKITVTSLSGTQSIIIKAINLITGTGSAQVDVTLTTNNTLKAAYTLSSDIMNHIAKATGVTYEVLSVDYDNTTGILTFNKGVIPITLVTMIAKNAANKEYTIAAGGELVEANLATLVNNKLTVTGNGETAAGTNWVKGSGTRSGVILGTGATAQTLELNNIAEWSGFAGNAVNNGVNGTVKVENVNFSGNTTADVANAGTLEFTGTNSLDKITGDGATEVKSGTTTVGSLAQGTLTVTSGELKNNGASTVGGGSNAGTISGTGSLTTTGAFENKSGATISQAVNHNGTNAFTNNGTISGAVDNSGTFTNNSTISSTLTNSGTFTNGNNSTISGAVTNTGTMTSAAEKMTGSVANNAGGILNLSGALAKNISGTGTTNVNSTLAMNSGAGVAGTLNMNGGTVTISNNAITSHNVGELKGNGNIAIDINYGGTGITSDEIHVTSDAQDSTIKITSINEIGTRAANFEKQILFGTDGSTKLALSTAVLNQFNKTHDAVDMHKDSGLNTNNTLWNKTYGTEHWTEYYDRTLSVNSSGNSIVYESVKTGGTDHTWNPEYDTLALMNQYEGTGYENRKIDFTGIHADDEAQGVYTLSAALGETKAGRLTLDGEKNTTTGALTVVDLNGNAGFNLTNATELVLDEVKLTGASGNNVITASNDGASVSLNDAYVDGNIVKNGGEKMTVTTTETTTLAGNTTNVSLTNSGTLTNNGTITGDVENSGIFTNNSTITGDVTNTGTMTSSANKLGGAIANNGDGVLNLSGTLAKEITGTGTTKVDSALTLAEGAEIAGKLDMNDGTVTMSSDSKYKSYTVGTLKNSGNIAIDAKASTADTDSFALSGAESGASIHISSLTFDKSDLTEGQDYEQKMHVLTGNGSVALTLDDSIANAHKETHYKISDLKGTDSVNDKDVAWNETFGNWKKERYKDATLAVNGKDLVYTVSHTFGDKTYTSNSEGLKELNVFNAGTETKTFNAEADGKEHRIIEDLGNTVGKLSIDGKGGTLDFDGKKGFVMGSGTEVSLKDVTAKNADKLADVKSGATLNLEDVTLENNGLLQNAGTINLSGVNSIDSIITGMGADATLNVNSDWEIDTTVTGHQVNVNGVKLTVGAGNLVGSDNLNVKDGAEVDITNSHITVGDANFESGSKLSLKVNSLGDFGAFTANKIAVANKGAKLSVTLAQGIQNGSVQLLKVTSTAPEDQNFNTFEDITDNNMYIFEKADKNGLYNIRLAKTAEEIVEESGGTANEARAAGAWVDGNEFAEGTVTKEIADTLADLAQNDVQALKDALEVITPVEAPATQESLSEFSDRLMLEVNNHLSINEISGLSSGDELSGVTLWAKGYYGKSKLNSHKNIKGFDTKKKGVIAGIDKKLDNNIKVGVGFQYEDGDVDAFRRDTDINTLVGFVYSEYKPSDWFVRGVASYGSASYDESKYALGINIKDKYHADVYSLQALTGYDLKYVTPEVGARYYYIKRHGYSDNIGQQMSGNNMDLLRGVMGLRTSYRYGMFKPEIYAGITYDFVSDEDNATISLPNGENYLVNGKRLNRFGTELNASVEAYITDELSATLGYEGKFRSHYQDHSGIVNVKYEF